MPQRRQLIGGQRHGNADLSAPSGRGLQALQILALPFVQIGQLVCGLSAQRALALIAGDEPLPVGKAVDRQPAAVGAAAADGGGGVMLEFLQLLKV